MFGRIFCKIQHSTLYSFAVLAEQHILSLNNSALHQIRFPRSTSTPSLSWAGAKYYYASFILHSIRNSCLKKIISGDGSRNISSSISILLDNDTVWKETLLYTISINQLTGGIRKKNFLGAIRKMFFNLQ